MASLRKLTRRINSVTNTKQITNAMKMTSTAKLQKAQRLIGSTRSYSETLDSMISQIATRREIVSHPLLEQSNGNRILYILITSDRGLCGGFNSNISKEAFNFYNAQVDKSLIDFIVVGKKAKEYMSARNVPIYKSYVGFFDKLSVSHAGQINDEVVALYLSGKYSKVVIKYNKFKSMLVQDIVLEDFLPIQKVEVEDSEHRADFTYDGDEIEMIKTLLTESMKLKIYKILLESYSSEQAARRNAMESATDNADDIVGKLTIQKNRIRQAIITTEINEIVSGAEALKA